MRTTKLSEQQKEDILKRLLPSINDASQYYTKHLQARYNEQNDVIESNPEYYGKKFPNLKKIPLTTSEVYDTINWIMPALVEIFSGSEEIVKLQGEDAADDKRAEKIQKLLIYQEDRLNSGFMDRYFWMLSALKNNIGFLKISWIQKTDKQRKRDSFNQEGIGTLQSNPDIKILGMNVISEGNGYDVPPVYSVDYEETVITENRPLIEVVPVTEVSWSSNTKRLKDSQFVKHRKRVTINDLLLKEKDGVYFDIDKVKECAATKAKTDTVEQKQREYVKEIEYDTDDLRREITIDECFCQWDIDENGKKSKTLNDWVFTVAEESIIIGAQPNTMGRRHPFVDIVAMPDPWNVVPRKGLVELLAEIQHINTALIRLFIKHLIKSNEGRRFVDKNVVDQDDLIAEAEDVGVDGDPRQAVYPMPQAQMSGMTMPFFQMMQSKIESTVGVTKYNTGTDAANLNPTATGVTALIDQANKKIKLIARIMAETGFTEKYRFLIALNQKYPGHKQFVRLLNEDIEIDPSDLDGKLDIIINVAGMVSSNKQAEIQNLQLIMGVLNQVGQQFPGMVTADKAYNIVKMLLEQMGHKNVDDFINQADIAAQFQQLQMENMQMKQMLGGMMGGNPGTAGQASASGGSPVPGGPTGPGVPGAPNPGIAPGNI